ncbi:MAG TPA: GNAT family N-acetyltransferase [Stellaceae bacterium]|nr:GNAT family N-acetyltransferase [Stellaceae bacterium]
MLFVRPAIREDAAEIARIDVETWRSAYAGILPDKVLLGLGRDRLRSDWQSQLAHRPDDVRVAEWTGAGVVGFGSCGPARQPIEGLSGEVHTLYVAQDHQGRGVGRALLLALFRRLVASGQISAVVWVLRENPGRFFYERMGGKLVGHRKIPVGGEPIPAVAYGWRDLAAAVRTGGRSVRPLADEGPSSL